MVPVLESWRMMDMERRIVLQAIGSSDDAFGNRSCNIDYSVRDEPETECMRTADALPAQNGIAPTELSA